MIDSQNRNLVKYPQFRNGHFRNVRFFKCLNDLERKSKAFLDKNPEKRKLRRTLSGLSLEDM